MKLITIQTAAVPSELAVIKSRLEDEGIYCFLKGENIAQIRPYHSGFDAVELQVPESDADRALEIIRQAEGELAGHEPVLCPDCGSVHTRETAEDPLTFAKKMALFFVSLITFVPFAHVRQMNRYHCQDCGKKFRF